MLGDMFNNNKVYKRLAYAVNWNSNPSYCLLLNPTIEKHITDSINDTSHFILICTFHSTFGLISSDGPNGKDSVFLSFLAQPWHWQEMVYFNWKLAKQNKGKRIPEWGPFLRELLCRWIMHMGESKQQPWALLGEQWAAHSPTRAPDFITGLSIPPAWELWDLGQAAAADRSCTDPTHPTTCRIRLSHQRCIPPLTGLSTPNLSIHRLSMGAGEKGRGLTWILFLFLWLILCLAELISLFLG